jgi:ABC-type uncharacterized transport system permease subunit
VQGNQTDQPDIPSLLVIRFALFYGFPLFLAVNVPARCGARLLGDPWQVAFLMVAAIASLVVARRVLLRGLASYRSASS